MRRLASVILPPLLFSPLFLRFPLLFAADIPNVLILLDTSGSMDNQIPALPAYVSTNTYPNAGYVATQVYRQQDGTGYVFYANTIADVPSPTAQTTLSRYGFWSGDISGTQVKLFVGNYLNYQSCTSCIVNQKKINIAK